VFEPDEGQTEALIRGFELATGEILGWLNSDDVYEPTALCEVVAVFDRNPDAVGVSGGCELIDGDGSGKGPITRLSGASLTSLLATNINLPQPATFFRREAYRRVGGLDPRRVMAMDVDLWMKLASIGTIELVPQTLARFRIRPGAKTQVDAARALKEDWAIRRRFGMPMFSPVSRAILAQAYWRPLKRRWQGRWRRLVERRLDANA
jgi:GT2 family glycosyltransferase